MSESDIDCSDEYTRLMDGHVAETRSSVSAPPVKRKKPTSNVASNIEVNILIHNKNLQQILILLLCIF